MAYALSDQQIATFLREGTLTIPNFFSPEQVADWRDQTYRHNGVSRNDRLSMPGGSTGVSRYIHAPDPEIEARLEYPYAGMTNTFTGIMPKYGDTPFQPHRLPLKTPVLLMHRRCLPLPQAERGARPGGRPPTGVPRDRPEPRALRHRRAAARP